MTKEEFKTRWESSENGGGLTYNDAADCYIAWGLGSSPCSKPMDAVLYAVLQTASVVDADEWKP